jgi:hypothetical protein
VTHTEFLRRRSELIRLSIASTAPSVVFLWLAIFHHLAWIYAFVYGLPILWVLFFIRRGQGRAVVLWLRKFDVIEPRRFRFEACLSIACSGLAVPVTIQDSAIPWSAQQASARMFLRFPLELLKLMAGAIVVLFPIGLWAAFNVRPEDFTYRIRIYVMCGLLAVAAPIIFVFLNRRRRALGVFRLDKRDSVEELRDFLRRIKSGRSRTAGGVAVFRIASAQWRNVVTEALRQADVVIIDVSILSEHLLWELEQANACLRGRQLILSCGIATDGPGELPRDVRTRLASAVGEPLLEEAGRAYYPRVKPRWSLAAVRRVRALLLNLQADIVAGLLSGDEPAVTSAELKRELILPRRVALICSVVMWLLLVPAMIQLFTLVFRINR